MKTDPVVVDVAAADDTLEEVSAMDAKKEHATASSPDLGAARVAPVTDNAGRGSLVDSIFDRMTGWAASRLHATSRGLASGARWLEARAKTVDDLATKLEPRAPEPGEAVQAA